MISTFSVRSLHRWSPLAGQKRKYVYEERITLWNAHSLEQAIDLAEREAQEYASNINAKHLGLLQGFWMSDECELRKQGIEVFSMLRESDMPPKAYVKSYYDTGCERVRDYNAEPEITRRRVQHRRVLPNSKQRRR